MSQSAVHDQPATRAPGESLLQQILACYRRVPEPIVALGGLLCAYLFIFFWLQPHNTFSSFPVEADDFHSFSLEVPLDFRPVSILIGRLLISLGNDVFWAYLNLLTLAYPFLVLVFVFRFLGQRLTPARALSYALALYSCYLFVYTLKYSGMYLQLTSCSLGTAALLCFQTYRTKKKGWALWLGFLLYGLCIFAKEDFVLPPLAFGVYHLIVTRPFRWKNSNLLGGLLLLAAGLVLYQRVFCPGVIGGSAGAYPVSFQPKDIWANVKGYWNFTFISMSLMVLFVLALVYALLLRPRVQHYFLVVVMGLLAAPFLIVPNRLWDIYAVNWQPWMLAFMLALIPGKVPALVDRFGSTARVAVVAAGYVFLAALCCYLVRQNQEKRTFFVEFYMNHATFNRNVTHALLAHKDEFTAAKEVGVICVPDWRRSPWNRYGLYLTRLGFTNNWRVFLDDADPAFQKPGGVVKQVDCPPVYLEALSKLNKDFADLLLVQLAPDGTIQQITRTGRGPVR